MLHAAPVDATGTGKAHKVQNVFDCVQEKSMHYYIPDRAIAVDETTIAFKGRVSCKMYNPQKPTKWGLRVYVLAESATGYISAYEPYFGRETTESLVKLYSLTHQICHLLRGSCYN